MTDEKEFESLDREWRQRLKTAGKPKVPEAMTRHFAASVENKILEGARSFLPLAVAVPAVLAAFALLAGLVVWFLSARLQPAPEPSLEGAAATSVSRPEDASESISVPREIGDRLMEPVPVMAEKDLASEIEILRELDVWTEEDERAIGISLEDDLADLEWLTDASPGVEFGPQAAL